MTAIPSRRENTGAAPLSTERTTCAAEDCGFTDERRWFHIDPDGTAWCEPCAFPNDFPEGNA